MFRFIISTGDVYNFHFIKNEKVMSIQDAGGTHFSIPLNSSIQFGILYSPVGNTAQAVKGYSFKTVGELAKYDIPPRIIRATQAFDVSDSKSSIEAEEILIVKKIGRTAIKRKHYVKVLSLHSRMYHNNIMYAYVSALRSAIYISSLCTCARGLQ